jgi:hypothetical protein
MRWHVQVEPERPIRMQEADLRVGYYVAGQEHFFQRLVRGARVRRLRPMPILKCCGEAVLMAVFLVGLAWPIVVNPSR